MEGPGYRRSWCGLGLSVSFIKEPEPENLVGQGMASLNRSFEIMHGKLSFGERNVSLSPLHSPPSL